jgi:hypothetical protein
MMPVPLRFLRSRGLKLPGPGSVQISTVWYDDEDWVVRYLSVQTRERSFVVPTPLVTVDERYHITVRPDVPELYPQARLSAPDEARHVVRTEMSRVQECDLLSWYQLPAYWGGRNLWGDCLYPGELAATDGLPAPEQSRADEERTESHVHAACDLIHDTVACPDGAYGWVDDVLLDLERWSVEYLIVHALPGSGAGDVSDNPDANNALISPFWGTWHRANDQIRVPFTKATIRASPAYKPDTLAPRDEHILARYYGFATNR